MCKIVKLHLVPPNGVHCRHPGHDMIRTFGCCARGRMAGRRNAGLNYRGCSPIHKMKENGHQRCDRKFVSVVFPEKPNTRALFHWFVSSFRTGQTRSGGDSVYRGDGERMRLTEVPYFSLWLLYCKRRLAEFFVVDFLSEVVIRMVTKNASLSLHRPTRQTLHAMSMSRLTNHRYKTLTFPFEKCKIWSVTCSGNQTSDFCFSSTFIKQ